MQQGTVELNGAQLYYEVAGAGLPLILLHAGIADRRMWNDQFEVFAHRYRVVRYDVRGFGNSIAPPDTDFTLHGDLVGIMDHLNIERAALVGVSMGGQTAIDFALANPGRVTALVPVCPALSGYDMDSEVLTRREKELETAFDQGDIDRAVEIEVEIWVDGPQRDSNQVQRSVRKRVREMDRLIYDHYLASPWPDPQELDPPARERLAEIRVPTLIVQGEVDMPDILTIAELLAKGISHAKKVMIPNAAHMVNMEYPEQFNPIVLDFLAEHLES
jgi:3-oxoadipate enol-lactonase